MYSRLSANAVFMPNGLSSLLSSEGVGCGRMMLRHLTSALKFQRCHMPEAHHQHRVAEPSSPLTGRRLCSALPFSP